MKSVALIMRHPPCRRLPRRLSAPERVILISNCALAAETNTGVTSTLRYLEYAVWCWGNCLNFRPSQLLDASRRFANFRSATPRNDQSAKKIGEVPVYCSCILSSLPGSSSVQREARPKERAGRSVLGRASLTVRARPSICLPFNA